MLLAWLLLVWTLGAAAAPQKRPHKPSPEVAAMSAADAQCAYRLIETRCPYPDAAMSRAAPHAWELCAALGRATSLSSACVFTHMLILVSLTLNALQTRYGGILGKFPNLLVLQHGAPGEGKSVALWLVFQILYFFDELRAKAKLEKYRVQKEEHRLAAQDSPHEDAKDGPSKPEHSDSVHNKGTFLGMGATLEKQGGRGHLGLHEGESWLSDASTDKPGGGFEDLNQLLDHDLYKKTQHLVRAFTSATHTLLAVFCFTCLNLCDKLRSPTQWRGCHASSSGTSSPLPTKSFQTDLRKTCRRS